MSDISGMTRTGRVVQGPDADLVELRAADGTIHHALVFAPSLRQAPALSVAVEPMLGFLELPMVDGVARLVHRNADEGTFVYATGKAWTISEVVDTLAREGDVAGVRAGLELCQGAALIIQEAAEVGHTQNAFCHGSLSPWRVLLDGQGRPSLVGYGLPAVEIAEFLRDDAAVPSAHAFRYSPPERFQGTPEDISSDTFVLALLAIELMTGVSLYDGEIDEIFEQASLGAARDRLGALAEFLPELVVEVLSPAFDSDPAKRYQDALEFSEICKELIATGEVVGPTLADLMARVAVVGADPAVAEIATAAAQFAAEARQFADDARAVLDAAIDELASSPSEEVVVLAQEATEKLDLALAAADEAEAAARRAATAVSADVARPEFVMAEAAATEGMAAAADVLAKVEAAIAVAREAAEAVAGLEAEQLAASLRAAEQKAIAVLTGPLAEAVEVGRFRMARAEEVLALIQSMAAYAGRDAHEAEAAAACRAARAAAVVFDGWESRASGLSSATDAEALVAEIASAAGDIGQQADAVEAVQAAVHAALGQREAARAEALVSVDAALAALTSTRVALEALRSKGAEWVPSADFSVFETVEGSLVDIAVAIDGVRSGVSGEADAATFLALRGQADGLSERAQAAQNAAEEAFAEIRSVVESRNEEAEGVERALNTLRAEVAARFEERSAEFAFALVEARALGEAVAASLRTSGISDRALVEARLQLDGVEVSVARPDVASMDAHALNARASAMEVGFDAALSSIRHCRKLAEAALAAGQEEGAAISTALSERVSLADSIGALLGEAHSAQHTVEQDAEAAGLASPAIARFRQAARDLLAGAERLGELPTLLEVSSATEAAALVSAMEAQRAAVEQACARHTESVAAVHAALDAARVARLAEAEQEERRLAEEARRRDGARSASLAQVATQVERGEAALSEAEAAWVGWKALVESEQVSGEAVQAATIEAEDHLRSAREVVGALRLLSEADAETPEAADAAVIRARELTRSAEAALANVRRAAANGMQAAAMEAADRASAVRRADAERQRLGRALEGLARHAEAATALLGRVQAGRDRLVGALDDASASDIESISADANAIEGELSWFVSSVPADADVATALVEQRTEAVLAQSAAIEAFEARIERLLAEIVRERSARAELERLAVAEAAATEAARVEAERLEREAREKAFALCEAASLRVNAVIVRVEALMAALRAEQTRCAATGVEVEEALLAIDAVLSRAVACRVSGGEVGSSSTQADAAAVRAAAQADVAEAELEAAEAATTAGLAAARAEASARSEAEARAEAEHAAAAALAAALERVGVAFARIQALASGASARLGSMDALIIETLSADPTTLDAANVARATYLELGAALNTASREAAAPGTALDEVDAVGHALEAQIHRFESWSMAIETQVVAAEASATAAVVARADAARREAEAIRTARGSAESAVRDAEVCLEQANSLIAALHAAVVEYAASGDALQEQIAVVERARADCAAAVDRARATVVAEAATSELAEEWALEAIEAAEQALSAADAARAAAQAGMAEATREAEARAEAERQSEQARRDASALAGAREETRVAAREARSSSERARSAFGELEQAVRTHAATSVGRWLESARLAMNIAIEQANRAVSEASLVFGDPEEAAVNADLVRVAANAAEAAAADVGRCAEAGIAAAIGEANERAEAARRAEAEAVQTARDRITVAARAAAWAVQSAESVFRDLENVVTRYEATGAQIQDILSEAGSQLACARAASAICVADEAELLKTSGRANVVAGRCETAQHDAAAALDRVRTLESAGREAAQEEATAREAAAFESAKNTAESGIRTARAGLAEARAGYERLVERKRTLGLNDGNYEQALSLADDWVASASAAVRRGEGAYELARKAIKAGEAVEASANVADAANDVATALTGLREALADGETIAHAEEQRREREAMAAAIKVARTESAGLSNLIVQIRDAAAVHQQQAVSLGASDDSLEASFIDIANHLFSQGISEVELAEVGETLGDVEVVLLRATFAWQQAREELARGQSAIEAALAEIRAEAEERARIEVEQIESAADRVRRSATDAAASLASTRESIALGQSETLDWDGRGLPALREQLVAWASLGEDALRRVESALVAFAGVDSASEAERLATDSEAFAAESAEVQASAAQALETLRMTFRIEREAFSAVEAEIHALFDAIESAASAAAAIVAELDGAIVKFEAVSDAVVDYATRAKLAAQAVDDTFSAAQEIKERLAVPPTAERAETLVTELRLRAGVAQKALLRSREACVDGTASAENEAIARIEARKAYELARLAEAAREVEALAATIAAARAAADRVEADASRLRSVYDLALHEVDTSGFSDAVDLSGRAGAILAEFLPLEEAARQAAAEARAASSSAAARVAADQGEAAAEALSHRFEALDNVIREARAQVAVLVEEAALCEAAAIKELYGRASQVAEAARAAGSEADRALADAAERADGWQYAEVGTALQSLRACVSQITALAQRADASSQLALAEGHSAGIAPWVDDAESIFRDLRASLERGTSVSLAFDEVTIWAESERADHSAAVARAGEIVLLRSSSDERLAALRAVAESAGAGHEIGDAAAAASLVWQEADASAVDAAERVHRACAVAQSAERSKPALEAIDRALGALEELETLILSLEVAVTSFCAVIEAEVGERARVEALRLAEEARQSAVADAVARLDAAAESLREASDAVATGWASVVEPIAEEEKSLLETRVEAARLLAADATGFRAAIGEGVDPEAVAERGASAQSAIDSLTAEFDSILLAIVDLRRSTAVRAARDELASGLEAVRGRLAVARSAYAALDDSEAENVDMRDAARTLLEGAACSLDSLSSYDVRLAASSDWAEAGALRDTVNAEMQLVEASNTAAAEAIAGAAAIAADAIARRAREEAERVAAEEAARARAEEEVAELQLKAAVHFREAATAAERAATGLRAIQAAGAGGQAVLVTAETVSDRAVAAAREAQRSLRMGEHDSSPAEAQDTLRAVEEAAHRARTSADEIESLKAQVAPPTPAPGLASTRDRIAGLRQGDREERREGESLMDYYKRLRESREGTARSTDSASVGPAEGPRRAFTDRIRRATTEGGEAPAGDAPRRAFADRLRRTGEAPTAAPVAPPPSAEGTGARTMMSREERLAKLREGRAELGQPSEGAVSGPPVERPSIASLRDRLRSNDGASTMAAPVGGSPGSNDRLERLLALRQGQNAANRPNAAPPEAPLPLPNEGAVRPGGMAPRPGQPPRPGETGVRSAFGPRPVSTEAPGHPSGATTSDPRPGLDATRDRLRRISDLRRSPGGTDDEKP